MTRAGELERGKMVIFNACSMKWNADIARLEIPE